MSANLILVPPKYHPAFNDVPVMIQCNTESTENYAINLNLVYDFSLVDYMSPFVPVGAGENIYTKIEFGGFAGSFEVGDEVFIFRGHYQGYYTVVDRDGVGIVIDLVMDIPYDDSETTLMAKYIRRPMTPRNDIVKYDIMNTIKDKVGTYVQGYNDADMYPKGDFLFGYGLVVGEEYNFVYTFYDNVFSGTVGFISTYTSVDDVPFQIGDRIEIKQDIFNWMYDDNFDTGGQLSFTSTNVHNFAVGDVVTITGQNTYPSSNGPVQIIAVPDNFNIVVDKPFPGATATEPGSAFGVPFSEYNRSATITDITLSGGQVVIITDLPFTGSSQPISGQIRLSSNKKYFTYNTDDNVTISIGDGPKPTINIFGSFAFFHRFDLRDYVKYNPSYGYDEGTFTSNFLSLNSDHYWSTILPQDGTPNRIDRTSVGWIKYIFDDADTNAPTTTVYRFYNAVGTLLGSSILYTLDSYVNYSPIGMNAIVSDRFDIGMFDLEAVLDQIASFDMTLWNEDMDFQKSKTLLFAYDTDCSDLPLYGLNWVDAYGSVIPFPFRYVAKESSDIKRSSYYKQEGEFSIGPSVTGIYQHENTDRGEGTYYIQSRNKFELTSGWLKDEENIIFEDLMKSTAVYIQMPPNNVFDNPVCPIYAVVLDPTNIEYKSNKWGERIFNYSPVVSIAFNDYRFNKFTYKPVKLSRKR